MHFFSLISEHLIPLPLKFLDQPSLSIMHSDGLCSTLTKLQQLQVASSSLCLCALGPKVILTQIIYTDT